MEDEADLSLVALFDLSAKLNFEFMKIILLTFLFFAVVVFIFVYIY